MFLPIMMLPFALAGFGGLALLVSKTGDRFPELGPGRWLRYAGFVCLFAGLGAILLGLGSALAVQRILMSRPTLAAVLFFAGYALGGCGGAALGFRQARGRGRAE